MTYTNFSPSAIEIIEKESMSMEFSHNDNGLEWVVKYFNECGFRAAKYNTNGSDDDLWETVVMFQYGDNWVDASDVELMTEEDVLKLALMLKEPWDED
jgi:hypothetical protein